MPWSEIVLLVCESTVELARAAVECGGVDGERADQGGEAEAQSDPKRRGQALGRHAVGEPDGDEHHRQRADQRDEDGRRPGEDCGHDELGHQAEAEREAHQRQHAAPPCEHDHERGEGDEQPQERAAAVDAHELVAHRRLRAGGAPGASDPDLGARCDVRNKVDGAEVDRDGAASVAALGDAHLDAAAPLGDRAAAAHVVGGGSGRRHARAAERLPVHGRADVTRPQQHQAQRGGGGEQRHRGGERATPPGGQQRAAGAGALFTAAGAALGAREGSPVVLRVPLVGVDEVERVHSSGFAGVEMAPAAGTRAFLAVRTPSGRLNRALGSSRIAKPPMARPMPIRGRLAS